MGGKFGIVTFHPKAVPDYENMIKTYGFEKKALAHPVRSLRQNLDKQMEGVTNPKATIEDFRETAKELIKDGAEVIIPGCLMLSPILVKSEVKEVEGVPVLDVVSLVIKFAEFMDEMLKAGLPIISRRGLYQGPDENLVAEIRAIFGL
jgi:Asp/Glu/hydantoin racemase